MTALGVAKPVPPPLDITNIADSSTTRVGRVTPTVATLLDQRILYQATSSRAHTVRRRPKRPFNKNTALTRKKGRRKPPANNSKTSGTDNAKATGEAEKSTTPEYPLPAQTETVVQTGEHLLDVPPTDSVHFDGSTNIAYTLLEEELVEYVS